MDIHIKRIYDTPRKSDGTRILVDRLWPRGIKKEEAHIDVWAKELAPTSNLRAWFHHDPKNRFEEFKDQYIKELKALENYSDEILKGKDSVTFITAVKDIEHSHASVLKEFLKHC